MLFNSIKGSHNIITGCGSGLGRGTLQWLLKHGSGPILGIDNEFKPKFAEKLEFIDDKQSEDLILKEHPTFDQELTEASVSDFYHKYGRIDNLINVAGVSLAFAMFLKTKNTFYDIKNAHDLLNFNTVGSFNIIRVVTKYMINSNIEQKEKRHKCIINTSCISTHAPNLGQTFHAGSKAALDSMTLCVARELSPFNIRCNTINVGYFESQLIDYIDDRIPKFIGDSVNLCPKRLGHPHEFAHLVQTIIENKMINGACIKIDAGAKEVY